MHESDDDPIAMLDRAGMPPPLARPGGDPDPDEDLLAPLLQVAAPPGDAAPEAPRRRLFERVGTSAAQARKMLTQRRADTIAEEVAPGVTLRALYRAAAGSLRRLGEPDAASLVELAPRAAWRAASAADGPAAGPSTWQTTGGPAPAPERSIALQREYLVLRGRLRIGGVHLGTRDYHVVPAGADDEDWSSEDGALLYLRASQPVAGAATQATTQRAAAAEWSSYAPGIRRRLLWQQGAQAAMLYHALPGAAVPHHGHRHDEECLMLAGDFFLDEVLLRELDYQLAPAGTGHHVSCTDTGVLLYAHGDIDLDLI